MQALHNAVPVFEIVLVRALVSGLVTSLSARANGVPVFGRTAPQVRFPSPHMPCRRAPAQTPTLRTRPCTRMRPQALLIARGVIGGSAMTLSYEALVRLPLADSTVIFYVCPALTALLCWALLGERFGWLTGLGCGASLAGVVLVAQPPWLLGGGVEWTHDRLLGMGFGFGGATLAAGAYTCIRLIGK